MKFQTLTYNRGWVSTVKKSEGAMSDDKVIMVTGDRTQSPMLVHDCFDASSLYKVFNRDNGQFGVVCANVPSYVATSTKDLIASDNVLMDYVKGTVRFPCRFNPQGFADGAVLKELHGDMATVDRTDEVITRAVKEKDTSLRFLRMGASNALRYLHKWRYANYATYYVTDDHMGANLQAIMLTIGEVSFVKRSNTLEVVGIEDWDFPVTDAEAIKNSTIQIFVDGSGRVIPCIRREVETGMIFVL